MSRKRIDLWVYWPEVFYQTNNKYHIHMPEGEPLSKQHYHLIPLDMAVSRAICVIKRVAGILKADFTTIINLN